MPGSVATLATWSTAWSASISSSRDAKTTPGTRISPVGSILNRYGPSCVSRAVMTPGRAAEVPAEPSRGHGGHLVEGAGLLEQVRRARDDLELRRRDAAAPAASSVEPQHLRVPPPTISSAGAATRASASPARSGRPPRETTAATPLGPLGRRRQRGRRAGARAEAARPAGRPWSGCGGEPVDRARPAARPAARCRSAARR